MVYDGRTLKIIDIRGAISTVKQEELEKKYASELGGKIGMKEKEKADVYCWGKCFYSMLVQKACGARCLSEGHKKPAKCMEEHLKLPKPADFPMLLKFVKLVLLEALNYKEKEPTMNKVVKNMEKFAKMNKLNYAVGTKNIINLLTPTGDNKVKECKDCVAKKEAQLVCGHDVCKECLIEYVAELFLKKCAYDHSYLCPLCNKVEELNFFTLDCKCRWINFKEGLLKMKQGTCHKGHPLSLIDSFLISDYTSISRVITVLYDYAKKRKNIKLAKKASEALQYTSIKNIISVVKSSTTMTELRLKRYLKGDVAAVISAVRASEKFTILDLQYGKVDSKGAEAIAKFLKNSETLRTLILENSEIDDAGISSIGNALIENKSLTTLKLGYNKIYFKGTLAIARAISVNKTLEHLGLEGCSSPRFNMKSIIDALKTNKTLKVLNLANNRTEYTSIGDFKMLLTTNRTLVELNLGYCALSVATNNLFNGLMANKTIRILGIEGNIIRCKQAKIISDAINVNKSLKKLNLYKSSIGDKGARYIAAALKSNKSLTHLNLGLSKIRYDGVVAMAEVIESNKTLEELHIYSNTMESEALEVLKKAHEVNKTIRLFTKAY
eukprot:TRINITY_DN4281_c0_g1_i12.p1 TRINITY_DN4281_c0_g1~~TRINITY_DN4281_c0_g1_i12.p1  ORF type:complete len:620 (-),score=78.64 TRINITY_DN4281_c0_g1_i12:166-1995(-)